MEKQQHVTRLALVSPDKMPQSEEVHHTSTRTPRTRTPRTRTSHTHTPRTRTSHTHTPRTHTLPLATSSLPPKRYRQSRFIEHLEDEAQLADPYEPPEPEDGAESQRRLEAGLGLRTTLFTGTVAHIAFTVLNAAQEFVQSTSINYLHFSNSSSSDPEQRKRGWKLIRYLDRLYVNS